VPIKAIEIHRALKIVLGINYNFHFLDAYISPERTEWYTAVQFRNDPQRKWIPRIIYFYPKAQKAAILNKIGDEPLWIDAATLILMANTRAQTPTPPVTAG
jgi:hypothetical protein